MKKTVFPMLIFLLFGAVRAQGYPERVVYGTDERLDYYQASAANQSLADSTAALFKSDKVAADGTLTLANYGTTFGLCRNEKFNEQPTGSFCSVPSHTLSPSLAVPNPT